MILPGETDTTVIRPFWWSDFSWPTTTPMEHITNSTVQGSSLEADTCSPNQETTCLLWNLNSQYHVDKSPNLSQMNIDHSLTLLL